MKRIFIAIFLLSSGFIFPGCKKSFLDLTPKSELIASKLSDYDNLLNNLNLMNTNDDGQAPMGDDAVATDPYFGAAPLRVQRLFQWADEIYDPGQSPTEITSIMGQLYTFNKIINEVVNAADGTDSAKTAIRSEALAGRAWCYFMLANYYGNPYNAATADKDLAFPIVTTADVTNDNFQRATVQAMYDTMVNDLRAAIPYVNPQQNTRLRMSRAGAEFMLGKILVFMGNYQDALPLFNAGFTDLPPALNCGLYDYNVVLAINGDWGYDPAVTPTTYNLASPTAWNSQENVYGKQSISEWNYESAEIMVSKETVDLFGPNDQRLKLLSSQPYGGGTPFTGGILRKAGLIAAQIGITMPEMYLFQAECNARLGNLSTATTELEAFRQKRMPSADAVVSATSQTDLVKFIIDERRREFVLQGHRWFDMRRLSTDPIFSGITYTHSYIKSDGTTTTYTLTSDRLTLKIPPLVLSENPGFTDNP